ncbi:MAG: hypothetical protein CSA42_06065 [Gammaproteobacteria bacterium]|nr:MAG: hypothetical protein CSA42_06065 [Gammaproteobacteria bacterium]
MTDSTGTQLIKKIDLAKWAEQDFEWSGDLSISYFTRISAELLDKPHDDLKVDCQLKRIRNILWLTFNVDGTFWLECQRCLQPVAIQLNKSHEIALLEEASQVSALDENDDYLMLDELVSSNQKKQLLDLSLLIEDELLLDLPIAPKHIDCEMAVKQVGKIIEEEPESPFAALAGLKTD